jgi:hypothetical protein
LTFSIIVLVVIGFCAGFQSGMPIGRRMRYRSRQCIICRFTRMVRVPPAIDWGDWRGSRGMGLN